MHLPGAGVGGHCIPKDPWLLIANANEDFTPRLVPAARDVNEGMPLHIVDLTVSALQEVRKDVAEARILVMGYAYLENSEDTRNSPSAVLVEQLGRLGAEVVIHDPYVPEYRGSLRERAQGCDVAVVMVRHDEYVKLSPRELLTWLDSPVLVDGRQVFQMEEVRDLTAAYRVCGVGR